MKKLLAILTIVTAAACTREPEMADLVKYMYVQTEYDVAEINDTENVFQSYNTFFLRADTIGFISTFTRDTILLDDTSNSTRYPVVDFVEEVIERVGDNTELQGFTRVNENQNPDFAINIVILENFSFFQMVSYPGYYTGYYGSYGGYYRPIVSTYSSNFVTMVVEVVDIKNYGANGGKYNVVWSAYIGDLLTTVDRTGNLLEAVNKAFEQSPYFSKE